MNCIRRHYSVWTTCPCPDCLQQKYRMEKLRRNGRYQAPDRAAAWARIDAWLEAGWTPTAMESAAGLHPEMLEKAVSQWRNHGVRQRFGHTNTNAILAADITTATEGQGPTIGSTRRLQALARAGHSLYDLHDATGLPMMTLSVIRNGRNKRAAARTISTLAGVYDRLHMTDGGSLNTATRARNRGWAPPLAWDDTTIDDPSASPNLGAAPDPDAWLEDVAWLAAQGLSLPHVASRLGVTGDTLERRLHRHGRGDLVGALKGRAA